MSDRDRDPCCQSVPLFSVANSASIISSIDRLGGREIPLLGWAMPGGAAGIATGIGSRVLELGGFGPSSISPRSRHRAPLREGEAAAVRHFRMRLAAAIVGAVILAVSLTLSHSRNAGYDAKADHDMKAEAISSAAIEGRIAILNAALDDAEGRLQSDPKSGLKVLLVLTALSGDAVRPEVERVAKISRQYLDVFRDETEKLVTEGKPEALARSEAFLDIDRVVAIKWLGRLYEAGKGGANKDLPKAFAFYREAASKGDKTATAMLDKVAHMMASAKDETARMEVFKYLEQKAKSGGPNDHYLLGQWYAASGKSEDQRNAEKWLVKALIQDTDGPVRSLSFSSLTKFKDVGPAPIKVLDEQAPKFAKGKDAEMKKVAYAYLEQRANAGDPGAMLWMGFRFAEGDKTPKDEKQAHDWFLKAALQDKNQVVKNKAFDALTERNHPPIQGTEPKSNNEVLGSDTSVSRLKGSPSKLQPQVDRAAPQERGAMDSSRVMNAERSANFKTCIDGRYPALCKHNLLTDSEMSQVSAAEKRANYKTCIDGRYPALCKHNLLTDSEMSQVSAAEKRANYKTCIDGRYPALCKHSWLAPEQSDQVLAAEKRENLRVCLDGRYPALCNQSLLRHTDGEKVLNAEKGRTK